MIHTFEDLSHWSKRFFKMAIETGSWSKDEKHKIGCIIVNNDHIVLSGGFNGFPRGVEDDDRLLYKNRDIKNRLIVHAEANAIVSAARIGHSLMNGVLYCTQPPCSSCAGLIIQAGITKVYFFSNTTLHWADSIKIAKQMFEEAGIEYLEVDSIIKVDYNLSTNSAT
jgi:dCMP deaminase